MAICAPIPMIDTLIIYDFQIDIGTGKSDTLVHSRFLDSLFSVYIVYAVAWS